MDILNGITRDGSSPLRNPGIHTPVLMNDRVIIEHHTPEGLARRVVQDGNVLCTVGLDHLAGLLASGTVAFSASNGWVQAAAIGTSDTAPSSNDISLNGATASVHISAASMNGSDKGARTTEYQMTYDDANPYTVKEVGLFASNGTTGSAIAHSTLNATDQIVKGTADTVYISHQLIFTTA